MFLSAIDGQVEEVRDGLMAHRPTSWLGPIPIFLRKSLAMRLNSLAGVPRYSGLLASACRIPATSAIVPRSIATVGPKYGDLGFARFVVMYYPSHERCRILTSYLNGS